MDMIDLIFHVKESVIDYPTDGLSPDIWDKEGDVYKLKPGIKDELYRAMDQYPAFKLRDVAHEIHFIGSMATNQYGPDSDMDVHFILDGMKLPKGKSKEEWQKDIIKWYKENPYQVAGRKFQVYMQLNPAQEYMADGLYDLEKDEWLKGPNVEGAEFDPYDKFDTVLKDITDTIGETDELIGELKRDVIDYKTIRAALGKMPKDVQAKLKDRLTEKLGEIEAGIEELMKTKKEWAEARKEHSTPKTPEQAKKDVELIRQWDNTNALFKFLDRYQYMRIISDLEAMLEDEKGLEDKDVDKVGKLIGVLNGESH